MTSKRVDSGDQGLEQRGVDLQGHSDAEVELYVRFDIWALCVSEARFVMNLCGEWQDWFYLEIDPTIEVYFTEIAPFNLVASCIHGQHCKLEKEGAEKTSKMSLKEGVRRLGPPSLWVRNREDITIEFLPCSVAERINCAPSQIHPNSWGFMRAFQILMEYLEVKPSLEVFFHLFQAKGVGRGMWVTLSSHQGLTIFCPFKASYKDFKEFYIKVRSAEDSFPFFLDGYLAEKFPLYWNKKPSQCLGVEELSDRDAGDRESVIDYLESRVPDCNTTSLKSFFKQRDEKEVSSSQVVKIEKGTELSKPLERRRSVSLKRMCSEEASGKKVIDLTGGKGHGKDESMEEVVGFARSQEGLHGFCGAEEQYPFTKVVDDHFRSKVDVELLGRVGKVAAARYVQVRAMEEEGSKEDKMAELVEAEKKLKLVMEQVALKERENVLLKEEGEKMKAKVSQLSKDKADLENRVVELCGEKKEAEVSKNAHGFEMFAAAWDRAKSQIELLVPGTDLEKMDPVKVV
ncbi:hypothetical protein PIB30_075444 [Stylosanthes scabra]|uniref:Transposase (putative) gypsy type domain-containing protein n=1 Tax=Stylosanthes scabra TaxID=79078 RepID=A0ABU6WNB3_9FABA|nr:hypothetical protein [Stylosanthes scabra]